MAQAAAPAGAPLQCPPACFMPTVPCGTHICPSSSCSRSFSTVKQLKNHCRVVHGLRHRRPRAARHSGSGSRGPSEEQMARNAERARMIRALLPKLEVRTTWGVSLDRLALLCACLGLEPFPAHCEINTSHWIVLRSSQNSVNPQCSAHIDGRKHEPLLSRVSSVPHKHLIGTVKLAPAPSSSPSPPASSRG